MSVEIQRCLTELENCFGLLLPFDLTEASSIASNTVEHQGEEEQPCCSKSLPEMKPPAATPWASSEDEDSDQDEFVRCHGLGSHKYTLQVDLSTGEAASLFLTPVQCLTAGPGQKPLRVRVLPCVWKQGVLEAAMQGRNLWNTSSPHLVHTLLAFSLAPQCSLHVLWVGLGPLNARCQLTGLSWGADVATSQEQ